MPQRISVFNGQHKLGEGNGNIDVRAQTAEISTWTDPAGLQVNHNYTLKSNGTLYSASCRSVNTNPPVATFDKLE